MAQLFSAHPNEEIICSKKPSGRRILDHATTTSSIRNQLKGKVKSITRDKILSEVIVETSAGIVTSVVTTTSVKELKLKKGDEVLVLIKATNVSLAKS